MPVAFVIQVAVAVVLVIVEDAAPGLVAAEVVGTPEVALQPVGLDPVFRVGAGGEGIETRLVAQDGIVGIPHLRGLFHLLARHLVPAQRTEQPVPILVVGQPPAFGADASHRPDYRLAAVLVSGHIHGRRPVVEDAVPRVNRRGIIGGVLRLRKGEGRVAEPAVSRRGGRAPHVLRHPALRPDLHRAIDIPFVILHNRRRRAEGVHPSPLLRQQHYR